MRTICGATRRSERPISARTERTVPVLRVRRLATVALFLVGACTTTAPTPCRPASGGEPGARAQLRFVDANDQRVVFTFGLASGGGFGLPAYRLEPAAGATDRLELRLDGVSLTNPDGTTSYEGPQDLAVGGAALRELHLVDAADGAIRWTLATAAGACPRARARTYTASTTFPRAQLMLFFSGEAAITVEAPTSPYAGTAISVSGLGFPPGRVVVLSVGGMEVHRTTADASGELNTGFFLPPYPPGRYTLVAEDDAGHRTETTFAVASREIP